MTMTVKVYHAALADTRDTLFYRNGESKICPPARIKELWSRYQHVATVEVDHLEQAFAATNHIDGPWWDNPGVQLHVDPKQRSTSVGDVLAVGPVHYVVASVGFDLIDLDPMPTFNYGEVRARLRAARGLPV